MASTHLVIPDQHANGHFDNRRALYCSQLIIDLNPDIVVNMGDAADLPSLCSYDKGTRGFVGRTYQSDINSHLDFQDKLWSRVKGRKKKLPHRVILEGNHEHRIERALDKDPVLDGTISFKDLQFDNYYNEVVRYDGQTPGIINIDGIDYAHYFVSGLLGRPISSEHSGFTVLSKRHVSSTASHSHLLDYAIKPSGSGFIQGLIAGCYIDYRTDWAGQSQNAWWSGVIIKRNVENGNYDPEFVSYAQLEKIYGSTVS